MKRLIALSLVAFTSAAALAVPALAEPAKKTELVALGANVDKIPLRYDFDAVWVVDTQNVLYRDDRREYYLVTLKESCEPLEMRSRSFDFHPGWVWELRDNRAYEVRPEGGSYCKVARIEKVDDTKATALRDSAHHRVW